jgi:hypothetical protein
MIGDMATAMGLGAVGYTILAGVNAAWMTGSALLTASKPQ